MTTLELIKRLLEFPLDSLVSLDCNYMQDATLTVFPPDGSQGVDVMES